MLAISHQVSSPATATLSSSRREHQTSQEEFKINRRKEKKAIEVSKLGKRSDISLADMSYAEVTAKGGPQDPQEVCFFLRVFYACRV